MSSEILKEVGLQIHSANETLRADGETRLESLHTIYRFHDGVCVEVERRRDCAPIDGRLVGMRLVGWLVEVPGGRFLVPEWQQGARGILWRKTDATSTIAMTSRTFAFVRRADKMDAAETRVAPSRPPMESMTRVFDRTPSNAIAV